MEKLTKAQLRILKEVESRWFGLNDDEMPARTREILIKKGLIKPARCYNSKAFDPTFCIITEAGRQTLSENSHD